MESPGVTQAAPRGWLSHILACLAALTALYIMPLLFEYIRLDKLRLLLKRILERTAKLLDTQ